MNNCELCWAHNLVISSQPIIGRYRVQTEESDLLAIGQGDPCQLALVGPISKSVFELCYVLWGGEHM